MFDRLPEPVFMALGILAIVFMLVGAFALFGGLLFVALGAPCRASSFCATAERSIMFDFKSQEEMALVPMSNQANIGETFRKAGTEACPAWFPGPGAGFSGDAVMRHRAPDLTAAEFYAWAVDKWVEYAACTVNTGNGPKRLVFDVCLFGDTMRVRLGERILYEGSEIQKAIDAYNYRQN